MTTARLFTTRSRADRGTSISRTIRSIVVAMAVTLSACDGSSGPSGPEPATTGTMDVTISGLPAGASAGVVVTGPAGFTRTVNATTRLTEMTPGTYTIVAQPIGVHGGVYEPEPGSVAATVAAAALTPINLTYAFAAKPLESLNRIVDSVRVAFQLPALAGAIVIADDAAFARGVAGTRRVSGGPVVTVDDLWHLGSNFKAFTGMLAAVAVDHGVIEWEARVADSFPEFADVLRAEYRDITLRELLSHQSGVPRDPPSAVATTGTTPVLQRKSVVSWALTQPPASVAGAYHYSNTGYMVAGAMLEDVLGVSFEDAMQMRVLEPLGITDAGFGPQALSGSTTQPVAHRWQNGQWQVLENFDNPPVYSAPGGAHMSLGSWSLFLQEVLRVEAGNPRIVSVEEGRQTTASHATISGTDSYGQGWVITSRSWANGRTLTHSGSNTGNHSVTWMAPLRGFAVVGVTNSYDGTASDLSGRALDALAARLISFYLYGH